MGKEKRAVSHRKIKNGRNASAGGLVFWESVGLSGGIAWLFYQSCFGLVLFPLLYHINHKRYLKKREQMMQKKFMDQYRELLLCLTGSLQSGYSVENAFFEAQKEMKALFGEDALLYREVSEINKKIRLSISAEKAFLEFSQKYPFEEVQEFAEIFSYAKRLGGDYVKIIRRCAIKIQERIELKQEIAAMTAEKRMELHIMDIMPGGILLYIQCTSPEFLRQLYHNPQGILVMSGCFCLYAACLWGGEKLITVTI